MRPAQKATERTKVVYEQKGSAAITFQVTICYQQHNSCILTYSKLKLTKGGIYVRVECREEFKNVIMRVNTNLQCTLNNNAAKYLEESNFIQIRFRILVTLLCPSRV